MDSSNQVKPLAGDNNIERDNNRYATIQDINDMLNTFRTEMINEFTARMSSLLQVSNEKVEKDVKTLRDEVSDLKAKSRELEGLILDEDARVDTIIEGNRLTQSGNTNNIRELWDSVRELEDKDINAAIDDRVWEQTQDLRETIEDQRNRLNAVEIQLEQANEEKEANVEDREPHLEPENMDYRITAIEEQTQYRYEVMNNTLQKNMESTMQRVETSLTAVRVDLDQKLAQITRDPDREEQRRRRAEEDIYNLNERQDRLGADIMRMKNDIMEMNNREYNMSITLGQVNSAVEAVQRDLNTTLVDSRNRVGQVPIANQPVPQQGENDGIDWFQDQEMGDDTMAEYSLMRTKKKKTRASNKRDKKRKGHGDKKIKHKKGHHDPGGSDDSSPSSSEESDESGKKPSRKRKEDTSDSSDGSSDSDDPGAVLHTKRFKAGNKRASIIGDEENSDSSSEGNRKGNKSSIIYVQPSPPASDLHLDEVKIGKVLYFCKRFNNESSKFRGGLNAANYINERVLSQMRQEATKHNIPGKHGILSNGKQQITNREVFAILSLMCAPENLEQMQLELSKSAWPRCKHDYKSPDIIIKNIGDFRTDMLIYIDRFEDKLKLLRYHDKSAGYIPKVLFKKGGGNPGLADYFLAGLPDRNFGLRVWYSVDEEKRSCCKKWDKFIKLYMKAIELMEKREKEKEINKQICRGIKDIIKEEETKKREIASTRKVQKVHNLEEDGVIDLSTELDQEDEYEEESKGEEEALPSPIIVREDDSEDDGNESEITAEDLAQLANVLQPSDSKNIGVCYDMLYKGKCEKQHCPYSHKEEDILKAKKLKAVKFRTPAKVPGTKITPSSRPNHNLRKV